MTAGMTTEQFGAMVEQYERLVYTICYQFTKDEFIAQDLAQETFLSAYTHREDCQPGQYKPWLARIATNKAKDYLKSAYRRRVNATEDDALEVFTNAASTGPPLPEDITIAKQQAEVIREEILALEEPYYLVAKMFFLEEKSVEEIAKRLERPPKTVHTQLYRAKQILKKTIERRQLA